MACEATKEKRAIGSREQYIPGRARRRSDGGGCQAMWWNLEGLIDWILAVQLEMEMTWAVCAAQDIHCIILDITNYYFRPIHRRLPVP